MTKNLTLTRSCFYRKKQLIYLLFLILFMGYKSSAQNKISDENKQFYKVISFGEKIDFGTVDTSVMWTITNTKNNSHATLIGNQINDYVFEEPGEYDINFQENKKHDDECNHPMFAERSRIKVTAVKLSYDFSKIAFSQKIEKGRNYSDLIITVPAKIRTKNNSIETLPTPGLSIAGLGVSFAAVPLEKEIILNNKTQLLKYKVSGMVNDEAYLMFDFFDFNNQVQTYNLPQIIK